jgi:hypothetical protein
LLNVSSDLLGLIREMAKASGVFGRRALGQAPRLCQFFTERRNAPSQVVLHKSETSVNGATFPDTLTRRASGKAAARRWPRGK